MNSPLQKGPDGLLGTLDLKTLGRSPGEFGGMLTPTLESKEFYLLRNRSMTTVGGAWVANGTATGTFTVPQTEVWRIKGLLLLLQRNVADIALNIEVSANLRRATSASGGAIFVGLFGPTVAADLFQSRALIDLELWLGPGDRIQVVPNSTQTAAASGIFLTLDYDIVASG